MQKQEVTWFSLQVGETRVVYVGYIWFDLLIVFVLFHSIWHYFLYFVVALLAAVHFVLAACYNCFNSLIEGVIHNSYR